MVEQIILGIVQGVAEWLPVSSEGLIVLIETNFFNNNSNIEAIIHKALFFHFGTFLAALIYFHRDIINLIRGLRHYKQQSENTQKLLSFLIISTIISGLFGYGLIKIVGHLADQIDIQEKMITLAVGLLLLVTASLELRTNKNGYRELDNLTLFDSILLGIVQGCATLPGLSRSGLTVSALLLRKIDKTYALKLSFLMSLPIVLGGNMALNCKTFVCSTEILVGIFFSFIFGLATIHTFLKLAEKINFGLFVLLFGVLTILSVLL